MSSPFVESMAKSLLASPPEEVVEQLEFLPMPVADRVRQRMLELTTETQSLTPLQRLWRRHWRDIKLRALAHRFYQHATWEVKEGDLYCITRYGAALYRVAGFAPDRVLMAYLCGDEGDVDPERLAKDPEEWDGDEFLHGGFSVNRVHIPDWIWLHVAESSGLDLSAADLRGVVKVE